MKKKTDNQILNNVLYWTFYIITFFVLDIIFFLSFTPQNANFTTIIFLNVGLGLLFSFLLLIKNKLIKTIAFILINILIIFYASFQFVETIINRIVGNVFTFSTILLNYKSVLAQYNDEITSAFNTYTVEVLILILIVIIFILLSKKVYFGDIAKNTLSKNITFLLFLISFILITGGMYHINTNVFDFESNMKVNGLKVAMYMDIRPESSARIIGIKENSKDGLTYEGTENNEKISTNSIINKPYYYDTDKYNVINFDFDEIIANEDRKDFNAINEFIKNRKPTEKNEYTGLFKGKNLIMICAEAWNSKIVDEKLFPTMYRLMNNGFRLKNFYQPHSSSSTSSGEYSFMTGMVSINNDRSFVDSINNNMGFSISMKLHDENYNTFSFHNGRSTFYGRDETHESLMGFDEFIANDTGLNEVSNQNVTSDTNLIKIMYDKVKTSKPFLSYIMTYNGHKPYTGSMSKKTEEYYGIVDKRYKRRYTEPVKNYIAKNMYLEEGLKYLIDKLTEDGLLNDTVICMVPDHYPYGLINVREQKKII